MSDQYLGEIRLFGGNFAPQGWAMCNGQLMAIQQNAALFSILGTSYGGNGVTTFALPDLRGRVAVNQGQGPGLSPYTLGEQTGSETVTLTSGQIASHTHPATAQCTSNLGDQSSPVGNVWAADGAGITAEYSSGTASEKMNSTAIVIGNNTGNQPHSNVQPLLALTYIIALQGIYPTRN
jgi:microcystin-dependent protein